MDVSAVAPAPALIVSRTDPGKGRRPGPAVTPDPVEHRAGDEPAAEPRFNSPAPVTVDAVTEAAVAGLMPVDGLPLAAAIHRYADPD